MNPHDATDPSGSSGRPDSSGPVSAPSPGDLQLDLFRPAPDRIEVHWRGKSNSRNPGAYLDPFLKRVTDDAAATRATVEMHFEALEFFNSSTITSIIQFVQEMRAAVLTLVIFYNPRQKWQRLSFDALRIFEKGDGLLRLQAAEEKR
jgi:hypothetical protein